MPPARTAPYTKEEPALTYSSIKQLIDSGIQRAIDTLTERFVAVEQRLTSVEEKSNKAQEGVTALSLKVDDLSKKYDRLNNSAERSMRHAFSFELLLHGVPETETSKTNMESSDWAVVKDFLLNQNLGNVIPQLDGVAYRLGPAREKTDRPRAIVVKDSSRRCRDILISKAGKRNMAPGEPYFSPHYTKQQLQEIRNKEALRTRTMEGTAPMDS